MIIGGDYLEWPPEYQDENDFRWRDLFATAWDFLEKENEMNKEYENWLWEQVLEDGPPQSDDLWWVKSASFTEGIRCARDYATSPGTPIPDILGMEDETRQRVGWI